jgi:hypothetical protein
MRCSIHFKALFPVIVSVNQLLHALPVMASSGDGGSPSLWILLANPFLDSSAPAALRQRFSFCNWFSGLGPLNQLQNERKQRAAKRRELKDRVSPTVSASMQSQMKLSRFFSLLTLDSKWDVC